MKNIIILLSIGIFISCSNPGSNEDPEPVIENPADNPNLNQEELILVSGQITDVKAEKDGQTISLTDQNGTELKVLLSIPNLRQNADQYREFKVHEFITFKGEYVSDQRMIVRELVSD
jgi:hypothetical protein